MKRSSQLLAMLALVLVGMVSPGALGAQGVTTSAVTGQVVDERGQPLPGIQIVVTNTATGRVSGVITRADGRYLLPGLQPGGPYRIEARGIGYTTAAQESVNLALGQTAAFDFNLSSAAIAVEGVTITSDRGAVISRGRTGTSAVVGEETIERSPTITRDFTDFTRLVPQVTTGATAGTNAAGRNNRFNNIQIDGAVNNDIFGLAASGTPGGQAGARPITLEAIQEFQVVIAPFDVRQGGFTGAGINAVTRSGTNDFSGSVSAFTRNENLVGRYTVAQGDTASRPVADFEQNNLAFSLGGPVVRDRVHFFTAGEISRRSAPTGFFIGSGGTAAIAPEVAQQFATILQQRYGYVPGEIGEVNLGRDDGNVFGRLDFSINPSHRLTVRHNYVNAGDDNFPRSNNPYRLGDNLYTFRSVTNSSVAQLNSIFANRFFNEFRLGVTTIRDQRQVPTNFPAVQVTVPGGSLMAGHEQFSGANALDSDLLELTNDLTWAAGRHNFTVGTNNQFFRFSNLFARNIFGYYSFANLAALEAGTPNRYEFSYVLPGGRPRAEFPVHLWSVYGQDQVTIGDNFTLTGGVRVELPVFPQDPGFNPEVTTLVTRNGQPVRTDDVPSGNVLVNPRLGFNWDVLGDRSTQLRGGVGFFSGRTPGVWISNAYGNTGVDYARITCTPTSGGVPRFQPDPNLQPQACANVGGAVPNEINTVDPDFRLPQVLRYSFGVDRRLPFEFVGTIDALYTTAMYDVLPQELTLGAPVGTIEGRTRWSQIAVPYTNVTDITNTSRNRSYNLTFQLQRRFLDGWDLGAAYSFSRSEDVNSMTSSQAFSNWRFNPIRNDPNNPELAPSNFDVPHRFLLNGSYALGLLRRAPTDFSFIFVSEMGRPFSYTYGGSGSNPDVNFDGSNGNDLIYVPSNAGEIRFTGTAEQQAVSWQRLDAFIESVACLREARGTVLGRNACREPWSNRLDFRVAQNVPSVGNQSLQITLDVLNFGNLLNRGWGLSQFVTNQNDNNLLRVNNRANVVGERVLMEQVTRTPESVFQVSNLGSRYQIQLGARYIF
jgi:hypothetical protein